MAFISKEVLQESISLKALVMLEITMKLDLNRQKQTVIGIIISQHCLMLTVGVSVSVRINALHESRSTYDSLMQT